MKINKQQKMGIILMCFSLLCIFTVFLYGYFNPPVEELFYYDSIEFQVEEDPTVNSKIISSYLENNNLIINYLNPNYEKVWIDGLSNDRYNILQNEIIVYNFSEKKDYFELHIGESSDIYIFGTQKDFVVIWTPIYEGLIHKEYLVEIQNLNSTSKQDFNLSIIINGTNFNLNKVDNMKLYEWVALEQEFPIYLYEEIINYYLYPEQNETSPDFFYFDNCWNDTLNSTYYPCNETNKYQDGIETKMKCQWELSNMYLIDNPNNFKTNHGLMNIPKYDEKAEYDDFGTIETINGTKYFRISFDTPIIETENGWGSNGNIGIIDEFLGDYYG